MKSVKISAAAAALVMSISCMGMQASAIALPPDWQPPEWVPTDFVSAMEFDCTYGATHIQDGLVCIVYQESTTNGYAYDLDIDGTITDWMDWCDYPPHTYELELPEKPDKNDVKAYRAYEEELWKLGISPSLLEDESGFQAPFRYTVYLFDTIPGTTMNVTINGYLSNGDIPVTVPTPNISTTYNFETDASGNTVETDWRGWLPDCVAEHKAFIKQFGAVSVHQDQYIVYAADVCYDGGIDVIVTQDPEDVLEVWKSYNLSDPELMPDCGGMGHHVRVFKAAKEGEVNLTIVQKQPWSEESYIAEKDTGSFAADENGKITEIDPPQPDPVFVPTAETAAAVQKYLLGQGELDEETAKNADMDKNNIINAVDLTLIKRYLLSPAAKETLTLTGPAGNVSYQPGPGADFTLNAVFSNLGSYDWLENASVSVYNPKTDMEIIKMKPVEGTNGTQWTAKMHYNIYDDGDIQFYAKLTAVPNYSGASTVEIKSETVTVHFSNEQEIIDFIMISPTLETQWSELGFGSRPVFRATLSQDGWFSSAKLTLYNGDNAKEICEMTEESHAVWSCEADLNVQEDCTMTFYCKMVAYDSAGNPIGESVSNVVSIRFCETPAPSEQTSN